MLNRGESYIEDVPSETLKRLVDDHGLRATTDYDELRDADAILIALPTPLSKQREPDLSIVNGAAEEVAQRLRKGHLVVLESTTYPGTTREEILPRLEASGLKVGEDFNLAFSPERVDPGREDWTTKNVPKVVGGLTRGVHRPRRRALRLGGRHRAPRHLTRVGRADEAAREHLPLGQHRARQRAGAALRADEDRLLGGRRRGRDQAVRVHELQARPRARRPLHPDRPLLPHVEGARVRLLHRVHRARRQGEREHAVVLPLAHLAGAQPRQAAVALGLEDPRARSRVQAGDRRHAGEPGAEADRAAPDRGRRRLLPRRARPRAARVRPHLGAARARASSTASRS